MRGLGDGKSGAWLVMGVGMVRWMMDVEVIDGLVDYECVLNGLVDYG